MDSDILTQHDMLFMLIGAILLFALFVVGYLIGRYEMYIIRLAHRKTIEKQLESNGRKLK